MNSLTTLLSAGTEVTDFNSLRYSSKVNEIGRAHFIVRLDNAKATEANLRHYNRIEITDSDGTVRWNGVISKKNVRINQVTIECLSLLHILDKRLTADSDTLSGNANTKIAGLITTMNSSEDTKIENGVQDVATSIDITFNRNRILNAIRVIADAVNAQFEIDMDMKFNFKVTVGSDKSSSILFQYNTDQIQAANIIEFNVDDIGTEITSKVYGKANTLTSAKEDATIKSNFGLQERSKNFIEPNDQATLDGLTERSTIDEQFSPQITLIPSVADNFEAGDVVSVKIKNKLIDIDTTYQILEKKVQLVNGQKQINVRITSQPTDFVRQVKELQNTVDLLSREI